MQHFQPAGLVPWGDLTIPGLIKTALIYSFDDYRLVNIVLEII
jgi:hypothetical protein